MPYYRIGLISLTFPRSNNNERMMIIKAVHIVAIVIGFTVFPLLGVIYYHTYGLIGGFGIGMVIALVISMIAKPGEKKDEKTAGEDS